MTRVQVKGVNVRTNGEGGGRISVTGKEREWEQGGHGGRWEDKVTQKGNERSQDLEMGG